MPAPTLRSDKIADTAQKLHIRIEERFPHSGLLHVCGDLVTIARKTHQRARRISRPRLLLRLGTAVVLGGAGFGLIQVVLSSLPRLSGGGVAPGGLTFLDLAPTLEAAANLLILGGTGAYFLASLETRLKRRQVLTHLHELRSLAHVVDMHQLTKDPVSLTRPEERTASSPTREMTSFQLARYLDYCAEMHAIIGKLAAIYAERTQDSDVIDAVNDIETLTTGLARKAWQKIMMVEPAGPARS